MDKFNLIYRLEIQLTGSFAVTQRITSNGKIIQATDVGLSSFLNISLGDNMQVISSPLTMKAQIKRASGETMNHADITVYNLSEEERNAIAKPRYNTTQFTSVVLYAGYSSGNLTKIFTGNLLQAYSVRVGVNVETKILASEGIFAINNATISQTYNKGFSFGQFIREAMNTFLSVNTPNGTIDTGMKQGAIGNVGEDRTFTRGITINGNTFVVLNKYCKHQIFIEQEFINIININDAFEADVPLISSETGLLNTPIIQDNFLNLETLFEPQFVIGQIVEIKSNVFRNINGQWKIMGMTHDLEITEGGASRGITKLQLFLGTSILNIIQSPK